MECVRGIQGHNPTTYRGKTLTWTRGRLLETYPSLASPEETWTFTYNADGIRVGKSAPGTTTTYGVDGERIVYEKTNGHIKRYFYDESGIAGFEYSGQKYVFRKNLQGDVTGIYNANGTLLGEYEYDAWGNLLEEPTNGVLIANPFRYRGYYYDTSIGLYYLNSRYYDPETGRFLNEDLVSYLEPETIGGINLYAYCLNDPVNNIDPSGHFVASLIISIAIGASLSALSSALGQLMTTREVNWAQVGISALFGAAGGALSFIGIGGVIGQFAMQGALSVGEALSLSAVEGSLNNFSLAEGVLSFLAGGVLGSIGAKNAAKEFGRVSDIEKSLLLVLKRGFRQNGISGLLKTWTGKSSKYVSSFLVPTALTSLKITGFNFALGVMGFWLEKIV